MRISIVIFLVFAFSFSCRKKNNTTAAPVVDPYSTGPYSIMQTNYRYISTGSVVTLDSSANAIFTDQPIGGPNAYTFIDGGTVSLNDSSLYFDSESYESYTPINIKGLLKWKGTGAGSVPAFTFNYTASYPGFTGGSALPDTCIKANGITLNLNGITNITDWSVVYLSQGSINLTKSRDPNNTSIAFSTAELASFNVNLGIQIELTFFNIRKEIVDGIRRDFRNTVSYRKNSWLK